MTGLVLSAANHADSVAVRFMIGQIGSAEKARKFLDDLRGNESIADTVFVTTGMQIRHNHRLAFSTNTAQTNWMPGLPTSTRTKGASRDG